MSKRELLDRIRDGLTNTDNIRNICVIAHVDHGKSTLTDALVSRAGLISQHRSGQQLFMMATEEEQKRGITIKSTSVSMVFDVVPPKPKSLPVKGEWTKEQAEAAAAARQARKEGAHPSVAPATTQAQPHSEQDDSAPVIQSQAQAQADEQSSTVTQAEENKLTLSASDSTDTQSSAASSSSSSSSPATVDAHPTESTDGKPKTEPFLVNLIDSPGHVDFSSEVTTALRVCDGALVVVDCVEGVCVQTETVLRQAIGERIKPVLFVNKLDRAFMELNWDDETCYQRLCRAIESVNVVIATYKDPIMGDQTVYPQAGTVGFGSGLQGWGFTLRQFAELYHERFDLSVKKMMKKLWGDNYYDPRSKRWYTEPTGHGGKPLTRAFNCLVLSPLRQLFRAIMEGKTEVYTSFLAKINVQLKKDDQAKTGKDLLKAVMQSWLPAADSLLDLIVPHLPSPATAQRYRVDNLYSGPMDDEAAAAIRKCDPNGPLVIYVSKMVPTVDKRRFYAFGRVFSGTVRTGQAVRIQGPDYYPPGKNELHQSAVQGVCLMMGPHVESVSTIPAGNMVGLVGVDAYLVKNGTITTLDSAYNFVSMKYSVSPVVRVAVTPENPAHIGKLQTGLQRLVKYDPLLQVSTSARGEHVVAGCGELHLEVCLKDLREDFLKDVPIKISRPVVPMCETVTQPSDGPSLAKSANKLNRVYVSAESLGEPLCTAIDSGELCFDSKDSDTRNAVSRKLVEDYKWDSTDAKKVWTVGCPPDGVCNLLVDQTKGVSYLSEAKDLLVSGFGQATASGVFADEPMRGIRFNVTDAKLHSEKIQRGASQLLPAVKRAMYASVLRGEASLMEPMYRATIKVPRPALSGVFSVLHPRRAKMTGVVDEDKSAMCSVEAFLPVAESFGFTADLHKHTGGQAFPQMVFDHWQTMAGPISNKESLAYATVMDIRKRKGMNPELPALNDYLDKL